MIVNPTWEVWTRPSTRLRSQGRLVVDLKRDWTGVFASKP